MMMNLFIALLLLTIVALAAGDKNATSSDAKPAYRLESGSGSSCTGPHEFCCEAPNHDPDNCPDSARTSDCDRQGACCCA